MQRLVKGWWAVAAGLLCASILLQTTTGSAGTGRGIQRLKSLGPLRLSVQQVWNLSEYRGGGRVV